MKTRVSLKHFVNDRLWKTFLDSTWPGIPSNLISLTILVTLRPSTLFKPKIRAIKLQKMALKFTLLGNCFSDLSTEIEIRY